MTGDRDRLQLSEQQVVPFDLSLSDEDLGRAVRQAVLDEERDQAARTTDEHGNTLPRLDLSEPRPTTDDPLLRIGYTLLAALPEQWEFAVLNVTAAAEDVRTFAVIKAAGPGQEGQSPPFERHLLYFPEVTESCLALRRSTYEAEGRTWYNVHIRIDRNGVMTPIYDFDGPPFGYWGPREVELVRRDQELFPRAPEQLPAWHPAR
jgi:hypothetical protein